MSKVHPMKLTSVSFESNGPIPSEFAFAKYHPDTHFELSANRNPHLSWSQVPPGTRSFVLLCVDTDVPSRPDSVNREDSTIAPTLPRVDFYHWVLVDIPGDTKEIRAGEFSDGITPHGKRGPTSIRGTRQGLNNYTQWFESDPQMAGTYFGYDGPCPPWNDSIQHHYHFILYAVDFSVCPVEGTFTGPDVIRACEGHVLGKAVLTGTYSLNPDAEK